MCLLGVLLTAFPPTAIATKRHGWVTNEDKLEGLMEGVGKGLSVVDWGPEEGAVVQ